MEFKKRFQFPWNKTTTHIKSATSHEQKYANIKKGILNNNSKIYSLFLFLKVFYLLLHIQQQLVVYQV